MWLTGRAGLPWWSFAILVMGLGMVIGIRSMRVPSFLLGFFCGFIIWPGAVLFFHVLYNGQLLPRFKPWEQGLLLLASGLIGGIVTGLALYTGKTLFSRDMNHGKLS